jgi:hypothetical protein
LAARVENSTASFRERWLITRDGGGDGKLGLASTSVPTSFGGRSYRSYRCRGCVEVIRLSKENSTVKYLIGSDSELAVGDTSEQSAMPARSVATKPTIENGESQIIEADDVAITGPNHSKDIVGAIEARGRSPIAAYSGQSNHQIDSE